MIKKFAYLILLIAQPVFSQEAAKIISWPPVNNETRPWTRWWLPGSIGTHGDISAALEQYRLAGLGGMELTVLYGVKGEENKFVPYLSPEWMKMFEFILSEAKKLDLGVDLSNGSSWPFGGPWVTENEASKYVTYKTYSLGEGETLKDKIIFVQEPFVRWNGTFRTDIKNITDPVSKNQNLQEMAMDQIRFEKLIPLQLLMAYSDNGKSIDITNKVDNSDILNWTAPAGKWTLYAVFQGWHGKMVERAGPGGEGLVIDHFSGEAINKYLSHFDDAFKGYDISYLRGYFNDSYEVDDARGQSCWTPDFFEQFRSRRGYDLKENLPALFQKDDPDKNARVLCDYRQTISDLILDKFTKEWTSWANKQGKLTRNQSHGSPGNILDLYAASDIPETEGTEITKMKFATSAANVSGKKFASAEAATWLGEHFLSTLSDVKKAVDQFFLAGVNHIFYHGTCFSPQNEPWPGFLFYAAVEFTPANSIWNDFSGLNNYVTRVQSFLQQSNPDNDILLYFPIFDRYSDYGNQMLEHFDAISPKFNGSPFKNGAGMMLEKGYAFDYISDNQIKKSMVYDGMINTGGKNQYKTLVLPASKFIPVETFNYVVNLADKGATIIMSGGLPGDVSGWKELETKREIFQHLIDQIKFSETGDPEVRLAIVGSGRILLGNNLEKLLSYASIRRESLIDSGLKFTRRSDKNSTCYFILNQSEKSFEGWIPVQVIAKSAALFNPMTISRGVARTRINQNGKIDIYASLSPFESVIIKTYDQIIDEEKFNYYDTSSIPEAVTGTWTLDFINGGPSLPSSGKITDLVSWTEMDGEAFKDFSGTARYSILFKKPERKADAWQLDLGKVCESARIILNGNEIATLIGPEFKLIINNKLLNNQNTLEILVTNLAANRIAFLDRNNFPWKRFYNTNYPAKLKQNSKDGLFNASAWKPRLSGLIGPVTLKALKKTK